MNLTRSSLVAISVLALSTVLLSGCSPKESSPLQEGLVLYRQNKLDQALPILEQAVDKDAGDADGHAWLAETYRRLGRTERAIEAARDALAIDPCHSFAHTVLAWAYNPLWGSWPGADADTTWRHLLKAATCDSTDGNIWIGMWVEALRRGQRNLQRRALRMLVKTEFLPPALLAYNRWMLRHLPPNALLLTNGDWDTYPAVALQQEENLRSDVVVANRSLLNTTWYARFLRDDRGVPLPFEDDQLVSLRPHQDDNGKLVLVSDEIIKGWLDMRQRNAFPRPIAISVTVGDMSFVSETQDHLRYAGPFWSWFPVPVESSQDTAMIRSSLSFVNPDEFSGFFVSRQDRSPVRLVSSDRLVDNVTAAAVRYAQALIDAGRLSEAQKTLNWAQRFERKTVRGPIFADQIDSLKTVVRERM